MVRPAPLSISNSERSKLSEAVRVTLAAIVLFLLYNIFIIVLWPPIENISDAGTENRVIAERYLYGQTSEAVVVGSSLGRVLGEWLPADIYDLSFSGGSPLTGIEIVLRKPVLPKVVVVETNIMERYLDQAMVDDLYEQPMYGLRLYFPGLRREFRPATVITSAVNPLVALLRRTPGAASSAIALLKERIATAPARVTTFVRLTLGLPQRAPLRKPPSTSNGAALGQNVEDEDDPRLAAGLAVQLAYNAKVSDASASRTHAAVALLVERVGQLQSLGVCVLFVRLPIDLRVDASPLERFMDQAVHEAFPPEQFAWIEIPQDHPYHTVDSLHMTRPSAQRVAATIADRVERILMLPSSAAPAERNCGDSH